MPVIQVDMEIPAEIYEGIISGNLIRYGGVVRDQAGRIVKHLNEVSSRSNNHTQLTKARELPNELSNLHKLKKFASEHKMVIFVAGLVIIGYIGYKAYENNKPSKDEINSIQPVSNSNFDVVLKNYLEAINSKNLDETTLDKLISNVDHIIDCDDENVILSIDAEKFKSILGIVYDYTLVFATLNNVQIEEMPLPDFDDENCVFYKLKKYLDAQKKVFQEVE